MPAVRALTLRHLLTNGSGYGMALDGSPLAQAMAENGLEAGAEPWRAGAAEWLSDLSALPLAFQPGEGWRYHHSYAVLGVLLARLAGRPLGEHLADDLFGPLQMADTGLWVPEADAGPAARGVPARRRRLRRDRAGRAAGRTPASRRRTSATASSSRRPATTTASCAPCRPSSPRSTSGS